MAMSCSLGLEAAWEGLMQGSQQATEKAKEKEKEDKRLKDTACREARKASGKPSPMKKNGKNPPKKRAREQDKKN